MPHNVIPMKSIYFPKVNGITNSNSTDVSYRSFGCKPLPSKTDNIKKNIKSIYLNKVNGMTNSNSEQQWSSNVHPGVLEHRLFKFQLCPSSHMWII